MIPFGTVGGVQVMVTDVGLNILITTPAGALLGT